MSEMVRKTLGDGWAFIVGDGLANKARPYFVRIEAPDGEVQTRAFATDNEARMAMSAAIANKVGDRYRLKE